MIFQAIPFVWFLFDRKLESHYEAGLRAFFSLFPDLKPTISISDHEKGLQNAIRSVFPDILITSCYFHYCKVSLEFIFNKKKSI